MIVPLVINTYPIDRIFIWTAKFKPNITFKKDCRFVQIIIKMDFKWFKSAKIIIIIKKSSLKKLNIFQF